VELDPTRRRKKTPLRAQNVLAAGLLIISLFLVPGVAQAILVTLASITVPVVPQAFTAQLNLKRA